VRTHRLSPGKVRHAKPGKLLNDGGGLLLQTTLGKDGRKNQSWLFRYSLPESVVSKNGNKRRRTRDMGLGPLVTISLHEARETARQLRQLRLQGVDPIEDRKARRAAAAIEAGKAKTFDECRNDYFREHRNKWRNPVHARDWLASLQRYVTPVFGKLPVKDIDLGLVIKALEPIWNQKPETASRVRSRVEAVIDFARVSGLRAGDNPARWDLLSKRFASRALLAPVKHHPALPWQAIPEFMGELRRRPESSARAVLGPDGLARGRGAKYALGRDRSRGSCMDGPKLADEIRERAPDPVVRACNLAARPPGSDPTE
jgi:hypothetical protein